VNPLATGFNVVLLIFIRLVILGAGFEVLSQLGIGSTIVLVLRSWTLLLVTKSALLETLPALVSSGGGATGPAGRAATMASICA
jgi:hypothetical protein